MEKKERFMGRGKNGNKLMGGHAHSVRCYGADRMPIRTFRSLKKAGEWLVEMGAATSVNSAQVNITHALNQNQHYWGKDHWRSVFAYGFEWSNV